MKTLNCMRLIVVVGVVTGTMAADIQRASADPALYRQAIAGTVWVRAPQSEEGISQGTGALIDAQQRLVVTAAHVVGDAEKVLVYFPVRSADGQLVNDSNFYSRRAAELAILGEVIGRDERRDLSLIQLARLPDQVRVIPLAAQTPEPGETIHLIGNSGANGGVLWRYATGTVRQAYFYRDNFGENVYLEARVIETQVPSNPGDSGGPMLNSRGELVATVLGSNRGQVNVNFGIDIMELHPLLARHMPRNAVAQQPAAGGVVGGADLAVVSRTLVGQAHFWLCPIPSAGAQAEQLFWATQFLPNGRFVELVVDVQGTVRQQTEGTYRIDGATVSMTQAAAPHWTGNVVVHNLSRITYQAPGQPDWHAERVEITPPSRPDPPPLQSATPNVSLPVHMVPGSTRAITRTCR